MVECNISVRTKGLTQTAAASSHVTRLSPTSDTTRQSAMGRHLRWKASSHPLTLAIAAYICIGCGTIPDMHRHGMKSWLSFFEQLHPMSVLPATRAYRWTSNVKSKGSSLLLDLCLKAKDTIFPILRRRRKPTAQRQLVRVHSFVQDFSIISLSTCEC